MKNTFYVTTAIPYVNAKPHIGHALEFVQGDVIARYHKHLGFNTLLLSGGDENALKNVQAAEIAGKNVQQFIDDNTQSFLDLSNALHVNFDVFQKGSDHEHHFPSSQELWNRCLKNGDIYKKSYEGLYCIGCEAFYTPEELNENGECFEHPGKKLITVKEENYFFRLSKYQDEIVRRLESDEIKIVPQFRKNEVLAFAKRGLEDISISRSNERAKNWGVPVPNDETQRMYVWFDALNIYQSGIGFGWDAAMYAKWWPADVHVIGKGISRFHAIYWPAFLLSAKLALPKLIFIHGYFTVNGQKMSKTLGNVIDPIELISKYGTDPLRYYFLREIPAYSDGDFSESRFKELYNADLANGLGNLVSRVAAMLAKTTLPSPFSLPLKRPDYKELCEGNKYTPYKVEMEQFRFDLALTTIWSKIKAIDVELSEKTPWKLPDNEKGIILYSVAKEILEIATLLQPFLPEIAEKVLKQYTQEKIEPAEGLFPRLI